MLFKRFKIFLYANWKFSKFLKSRNWFNTHQNNTTFDDIISLVRTRNNLNSHLKIMCQISFSVGIFDLSWRYSTNDTLTWIQLVPLFLPRLIRWPMMTVESILARIFHNLCETSDDTKSCANVDLDLLSDTWISLVGLGLASSNDIHWLIFTPNIIDFLCFETQHFFTKKAVKEYVDGNKTGASKTFRKP